MRKEPRDDEMREILIRLMAMDNDQLDDFTPKNQKETLARAIIRKAQVGDMKAVEFIMWHMKTAFEWQ